MGGDARELLIAGRGLRFAGWLVDTLAIGALGLVLLVFGVTGWSRVLVIEVVAALDAIVLVTWFGGNVGNLAVGTQVVVADDSARAGAGRAAVRWCVIKLPMYAVLPLGGWWIVFVWPVVVYAPILFTDLCQGVHDRAAGVAVVASRRVAERWTLAHAVDRVRR